MPDEKWISPEVGSKKTDAPARMSIYEMQRKGLLPRPKVKPPMSPEERVKAEEKFQQAMKEHPPRFEDGKLVLPALQFSPKEREIARAWIASLTDKRQA